VEGVERTSSARGRRRRINLNSLHPMRAAGPGDNCRRVTGSSQVRKSARQQGNAAAGPRAQAAVKRRHRVREFVDDAKLHPLSADSLQGQPLHGLSHVSELLQSCRVDSCLVGWGNRATQCHRNAYAHAYACAYGYAYGRRAHAYGPCLRSMRTVNGATATPAHAAWRVKQDIWVCAGTWQQEAKGVGRMRARGSVRNGGSREAPGERRRAENQFLNSHKSTPSPRTVPGTVAHANAVSMMLTVVADRPR
jgi:hypothetical protein